MNTAAAPRDHRFSAGVLAVLVHLAFVALLVFGLSWQAKEPPATMVDLWSKLPGESPPPPPASAAAPAVPPPAKKVEPRPPLPTLKAKSDIAMPNSARKEKPKQKEIPPVPPQIVKREQAQIEQKRLEQIRQAANRQAEITRELVAKAELDQARAEMARQAQAKQSAAAQSQIDDYTNRIRSRIRSKLNRDVCGEGNPQLVFDIALLPTGELSSNPVLRKSSGLPACDKAVSDAVVHAQPLPVPSQPEIFDVFRNLHLNFKPNE